MGTYSHGAVSVLKKYPRLSYRVLSSLEMALMSVKFSHLFTENSDCNPTSKLPAMLGTFPTLAEDMRN